MTEWQLRVRIYEWTLTVLRVGVMLSAMAICFALAFHIVRWAIS